MKKETQAPRKFKGTPAPWVTTKGSLFPSVHNSTRFEKDLSSLSIHVLLYDEKTKDLHKSKENKANARVVQNAPLLLEACEELVRYVEGQTFANATTELDLDAIKNLLKQTF